MLNNNSSWTLAASLVESGGGGGVRDRDAVAREQCTAADDTRPTTYDFMIAPRVTAIGCLPVCLVSAKLITPLTRHGTNRSRGKSMNGTIYRTAALPGGRQRFNWK